MFIPTFGRFFYSNRHLLINRQPLRHGKAVILQHE